MKSLTLTASCEDQSARIAAALAPQLQAGDVVLLDGALAAGKTFFTRALVKALGSDENATSPTYTIANIYETPRMPVLHVDAYRLQSGQEFYALGLDDYFETGLCVIEWGVRIDGFFDTPLSIHLGFGEDDAPEDTRVVTFTSDDPRWSPVLRTLQEQLT